MNNQTNQQETAKMNTEPYVVRFFIKRAERSQTPHFIAETLTNLGYRTVQNLELIPRYDHADRHVYNAVAFELLVERPYSTLDRLLELTQNDNTCRIFFNYKRYWIIARHTKTIGDPSVHHRALPSTDLPAEERINALTTIVNELEEQLASARARRAEDLAEMGYLHKRIAEEKERNNYLLMTT
jgi:hypothetical protein